MKRRSRTRRVLKWTFTGASLLILLFWGGSLPIGHAFPMRTVDVCFDDGYLEVEWGSPQKIGYYSGMAGNRWGFDLPTLESRSGWSRVSVPLWCPLLATIIPAAVFWWTDRRRYPTAHCQHCGYDLTGNVSGRCPECGTAVGDNKPADSNA